MTDFSSVFKSARPRALASLRSFCGDLDRAEDAIQDAVEQALKHWSRNGLPDQPTAWLIQVGKRKLIDEARRARFALPIAMLARSYRSVPSGTCNERAAMEYFRAVVQRDFSHAHPPESHHSSAASPVSVFAGRLG